MILNMPSYVAGRTRAGQVLYHLAGGIVHIGDLAHTGHYRAFSVLPRLWPPSGHSHAHCKATSLRGLCSLVPNRGRAFSGHAGSGHLNPLSFRLRDDLVILLLLSCCFTMRMFFCTPWLVGDTRPSKGVSPLLFRL